jgi:Na+-driven multidrug efflux pump
MTLFGEQLLGLYAPGNAAVIEKGMVRLYIVGLTHFICGIMEVGCGCVRGIGKSILPMIVSLLGACVSRVIWVFTVFQLVPDEIRQQTLYYSYPLSWVLTAAVHFLVFFIVLRKTKRKWDNENVLLRT